ncbi:MAG: amino acid adenylation domain-containing protein [Proteobacteria bacterium]|nr:amino acid adenylation domain-containing protein [Pseudomonadota bacterium]
MQYADFAGWQRKWLSGDTLEQQIAFWKKHLDGAPPLLELPYDHVRPATPTHRAGTFQTTIPATLASQLKALARAHDASLFMVLRAAFAVLMQRWSRNDDLVIGSPVANRVVPEIEGLIGFFVNTLALRSDLSGNPTFLELLEQTRRVCLDAYTHQDLPFEKIVAELNPERRTDAQPIVQVSFALQNTRFNGFDLADLLVTGFAASQATVRYDLEVHLFENEDALECVALYATDLFMPQTGERLVHHFVGLLEQICERSALPISALTLGNASESEVLLKAGNRGPRDESYTQRDPETLTDIFRDRVAESPHAIALVENDQQISYIALHHASQALARVLHARGVLRDTRVGLLTRRGRQHVALMLAVLECGGTYVPLDADWPHARLRAMAEDARLALIITDAEQSHSGTWPCLVVSSETLNHEAARNATHAARNGAEGAAHRSGACDDLAYIMYTSGSTGTPKGVAVTHRNITRLVRGSTFTPMTPGTTWLHLAPAAFDASTLEIWAPLLNGGRLVIETAPRPSLGTLESTLHRQQITSLWLTAGLFHLVVDERPHALNDLHSLLAGGDALSPEHVTHAIEALAGGTLVNGYGPTENTTFTACHPMRESTTIGRTVPLGTPIHATTVYILDDHLNPCPVGIPGELYTGGQGVARGYVDRPGLTADRFIADPFTPDSRGASPADDAGGARMYRTGDRCRWIENPQTGEGQPPYLIEFLGRVDDQVKLRGFRIEPGEIEATLRHHEAVRAAVVAVRDSQLIAWLEPDRESAALQHDLTRWRHERISQWRTLYESSYGQRQADDLTFDITGWNSSYTGQPIPADEMREWVDATVARIREVMPRMPPRSAHLRSHRRASSRPRDRMPPRSAHLRSHRRASSRPRDRMRDGAAACATRARLRRVSRPRLLARVGDRRTRPVRKPCRPRACADRGAHRGRHRAPARRWIRSRHPQLHRAVLPGG